MSMQSSHIRDRLFPRLREHAEQLSSGYERIAEHHRLAGETLARWIAANPRPGESLNAIVICTGNSRRSIFGSSMGNLAAGYFGMPEVRFHSGGTDPTAFNVRTAEALKAIGFEIEPTGTEARRGEAGMENPVSLVVWGDGLEMLEFSKRYHDPSDPGSGFAALMVCGEADAGCPIVGGAGVRIPMPFDDPKVSDGRPDEAERYAERRDDIGRLMLAALSRAVELMTTQTGPNTPSGPS